MAAAHVSLPWRTLLWNQINPHFSNVSFQSTEYSFLKSMSDFLNTLRLNNILWRIIWWETWMKTLLQTTQFLTRIRHEGHLIFPFHVCMQNVTHTLRTCAVPKAITRTKMQICSEYALTLKLLRQTSYWFVQVHDIFQCKIYLYISKGRQQQYTFSSFAWGIHFTFIFKLDLLLNCILMSL